MSFRFWASIVTVVLVALVIFLGWDKIVQAWNLLGSVNIWVLLLLIPIQFASYFATGGMIFSYLRSKGDLKEASQKQMTRVALEFNFVNHVFPTAGDAIGFSYLCWSLGHFGVSVGRATMAQMVRFVTAFTVFMGFLLLSVFVLILDQKINRAIIFMSALLLLLIIVGLVLFAYAMSNHQRLIRFSSRVTRIVNLVVRKLTRGKKPALLKLEKVEGFFTEMHHDYLAIVADKKILKTPFIWAIVFNIADVLLLFVAFWSLGFIISPAILFVAFGIAAVSSMLAVTPGGTGVYEAVMIAFLISAGVPAEAAIAGTLLARVVLLLGTVISGYAFYQLTINKYGKPTKSTDI
ncbi:MAG: lysylphosphatidylglycerol synthase transmembrane domain-containing protein [Candidatus Saccharibacteria bacterium]